MRAVSVPPSSPEPRPGIATENCLRIRAGTGEAALLEIAALCDEEIPLRGREVRTGGESLLDAMREREVDVVAAEQQMVAHGDALDVRHRRAGLAG